MGMREFFVFCGLLLVGTAAWGQRWTVAVNAGDVIELGTLGLEGSVAAGQHWSVHAGAKVNPWTFGRADAFYDWFQEPNPDQLQDRKQVYAVGARWWPWNVYSGWWLSGKLQYQEYSRGGARFPAWLGMKNEEGDAFGAALAGGYSLMIKEHWNVDFGFGVWGGWTKFTAFACPACGKVVGQGGKGFFLPNELILSLVYVF